MNAVSLTTISLLVFAAIGCRKEPPRGDAASNVQSSTLSGREWVLIALGERSEPTGAGGRPATLRFDAATALASGFAGCNGFSAPYTIDGDSLKFGPAVSTKMFCTGGMELETGYFAALATVVTHRAQDSTLTLSGAEGPVAEFRAR